MTSTSLTTAGPAPTDRSGFRDATRILTSVLAPVEKRGLLWMAQRIPLRINSDHLTGLALLAMAGAGASYWLARGSHTGLVLAIGCLAINWFGDSLDGTLARVRDQQRPRYGFYVDHAVDCVGAAFLLGGLGLSGYMHPYVALGLLAAYLLLSAEAYLATYCVQTFRISFFKIGPTELRILLSIGNLVLLVHPNVTVLGHTYRLFDAGGGIGIIGLIVTFTFAAIRNTRTLYVAEPRPGSDTDKLEV